jgi:FdhE protein
MRHTFERLDAGPMIPRWVNRGSDASIVPSTWPRPTKRPGHCCWLTAGCSVCSATVTRRCAEVPIVCVAPMLAALAAVGPPPVADEARRLLDGASPAIDATLRTGWHAPSDHQFFAKAALQPYAERLAAIEARPLDRDLPPRKYACPFCGGSPQLSILQSVGDGGDSGGRQLLCATCSTTWPFGRVRCAYCGEEDEHRLGYYHAPLFDHLRVDVCETCRHYLKTVDLTRLGVAVPVVDEVAGASLDIWAHDQGYEKIELNLVGL